MSTIDDIEELKDYGLLENKNVCESDLKYAKLLDDIAAICANAVNGDYCKHCWKFQPPFKAFCSHCDALSDILTDLHKLLDKSDSEHLIDELVQQLITAQEKLNKIEEFLPNEKLLVNDSLKPFITNIKSIIKCGRTEIEVEQEKLRKQIEDCRS